MFPQKNHPLQSLQRRQEQRKAANKAVIGKFFKDYRKIKANLPKTVVMPRQGKNRFKRMMGWLGPQQVPVLPAMDEKGVITAWKFRSFLRKKGFQELGSGCHGSVYGHPKSTKVVKINHVNDCWIDFMKWSHDNGYAGKFTPRLHSFKNYGKFSVSVIDRMDMTITDEVTGDGAMLSQAFYQTARRSKASIAPQILEANNPGMAAFAVELNQFAVDGGYHRDWHGANFMLKDGKLFATDPVSGGYGKFFPYKRLRLTGTELKTLH